MISKLTEPPRKKLRSQDPDIVIVVGSGENKQEFECYSQILCYSCPYFDTMLSHSMKEKNRSRIELPDKDPEEWNVFYDFIDPVTSGEAQVTADNAMILVPWFHEYQMYNLCKKCDEIISGDDYVVRKLFGIYHYRGLFTLKPEGLETRRVENVMKLFDFIDFCDNYSLENSMSIALEQLAYMMEYYFDLWKQNQDLFKKLIELYQHYSNDERFRKNPNNDLHQDYILIQFFDEIANGEMDWENEYFQHMINSKFKWLRLVKN